MFQRGFKPHARDKIGVSSIGWMITLRIINEFKKKLIKMVAKGKTDRPRALEGNLKFLKFNEKLACSRRSVTGDD